MTKSEMFREYASYHRDTRNRVCHAIGIPAIVLGLMSMLATVHAGSLDAAFVIALAVLVYYAAIDLRGAVLCAVIFAIAYVVGRQLAWPLGTGIFIFGWVFQLVGHRFEGTKPKFLENLVYLLIGPLYVFEELASALVRRARILP